MPFHPPPYSVNALVMVLTTEIMNLVLWTHGITSFFHDHFWSRCICCNLPHREQDGSAKDCRNGAHTVWRRVNKQAAKVAIRLSIRE